MTTTKTKACRAEPARAVPETEERSRPDKVRRILFPDPEKRAREAAEEEPVMSDEEVREGLKEAFRCLKSEREGKLKAIPIEEVLDEL